MNTDELRRGFDRDGFAILPGFKSDAEIALLRARAEAIVEEFEDPSATIFSTKDQAAKSDRYFLTSGDTIRCFFEEEAFDEQGRLRVPKQRAINKIGHAMHDLDRAFDRFSHGEDLQEIATAMGLTEPRVYQSMYIFKQPGIGGEVRWHQDASFFVSDPLTVTTFWFALEDADRSNGCLWLQPGGHRSPMRQQFVVSNGTVELRTLDEMPWPSLDEAVPLEIERGTLVVFHGLLPHYSAPNRSSKSRHAYTLHAVDARAQYAPENWLQRRDDFPARDFIGDPSHSLGAALYARGGSIPHHD